MCNSPTKVEVNVYSAWNVYFEKNVTEVLQQVINDYYELTTVCVDMLYV